MKEKLADTNLGEDLYANLDDVLADSCEGPTAKAVHDAMQLLVPEE